MGVNLPDQRTWLNPERSVPKLAVVVLTYNGWGDVSECLRSLSHSDFKDFTVMLVDNGSSSAAPSGLLEELPPFVRVIRTGKNLGISGGNNVGLRAGLLAGAPYLMTLSDDTVVEPAAIGLLVDFMDKHPNVGAVGAGLFDYAQPDYLWFGGGRYIAWQARAPHRTRWLMPGTPCSVVPTDLLLGCNSLIRKEVVTSVGLFDEEYFFQTEDLDFSVRVRQNGWLMAVHEGARIKHKIGQTIGEQTPNRWYYASRNRLLFIEKQLSGGTRLLATLLFFVTRPPLFAKWAAKGRFDLIRASLEGIRDFVGGRSGPRPTVKGLVGNPAH